PMAFSFDIKRKCVGP
ncbi:hypothetical protein D043_3440B, partial [Vibrio parahaemolyticus EKP-021]